MTDERDVVHTEHRAGQPPVRAVRTQIGWTPVDPPPRWTPAERSVSYATDEEAQAASKLSLYLTFLGQGNARYVDAVASFAHALRPDQVVDVFDAAARACDGMAIERLYDIFGAVEFGTAPLCHALAQGNESAVRALLAHGETLEAAARHIAWEGDTSEARAQRLKRYLEVKLAFGATDAGIDQLLVDEMARCRRETPLFRFDAASLAGFAYRLCVTKRGRVLFAPLANEGLLCGDDLRGLALALALAEHFDEARALLDAGAREVSDVTVACKRAGEERRAPTEIVAVDDLLYPGCSPGCAAFVCAEVPERVASRWDGRFLEHDPRVVATLVHHLGERDVDDVGGLLCVLAAQGYLPELSLVLQWGSAQRAELVQRALEAAADAGQFEASGVLLEKKRSLAQGGFAPQGAVEDL